MYYRNRNIFCNCVFCMVETKDIMGSMHCSTQKNPTKVLCRCAATQRWILQRLHLKTSNSYKLSLHKGTIFFQKWQKSLYNLLLLFATIYHSTVLKQNSIYHFRWVMQTTFCEAAVAQSTVMQQHHSSLKCFFTWIKVTVLWKQRRIERAFGRSVLWNSVENYTNIFTIYSYNFDLFLRIIFKFDSTSSGGFKSREDTENSLILPSCWCPFKMVKEILLLIHLTFTAWSIPFPTYHALFSIESTLNLFCRKQ